jgi:hypothetical protein
VRHPDGARPWAADQAGPDPDPNATPMRLDDHHQPRSHCIRSDDRVHACEFCRRLLVNRWRLLRICECVVTAVLGGLPPGSGPVVSGDSLRIWPRKRVPFI